MEFEWLNSKRTSGKLKGDDWIVAITERARLLARLRYTKGHTIKRCEQDLSWNFGDKSSWPITATALKKLVAEAYRVSNR